MLYYTEIQCILCNVPEQHGGGERKKKLTLLISIMKCQGDFVFIFSAGEILPAGNGCEGSTDVT